MGVRFGPFDAEIATGELRKHGVRLQVQDQPFRVLAALLERPGEVVSREELIALLWPDGTHVDFDRGLNAAVTRLRQALSDSAEQPRYIETVPKRGYRFIAQVEAEIAPALPSTAPSLDMPPAVPAPKRSRILPWIVPGFVALVLIAALRFRVQDATGVHIQPVPLTSYPGYECRPSLSPDGKYVAFDWTRGPDDTAIYVKLTGEGDPVRITSPKPARDFNPVWSPDGRHIAFLRIVTRKIEVRVTAALGGAERKLYEFPFPLAVNIPGTSYSGMLSWTPDGKYLATTAVGTDGAHTTGILRVSVENGASHWVIAPPVEPYTGYMQPAFSPDGRMLAFVRRVSLIAGDVYLAPYSSESGSVGQAKRLTRLERMIGGIAWLPNGRSLLFAAGYNPSVRMYRYDLEPGGDAIALQWAGDAAYQPRIVSSGALVFTRRTHDLNIWRQEIPASPGTLPPPVRLIDSTELDGAPQYSPDGTRIAFTSTRSGVYQLWTCASDGTKCAQLTHQFSGAHTGSPKWSPDGRLIAFSSVHSGNYDIYVMPSDGGAIRRLTDDPADDSAPYFSSDGRQIYFTSVRSGRPELWRMPADGGPATQITTNGAERGMEATSGLLIYGRVDEAEARLVTIWKKAVPDVPLARRVYSFSWTVAGDRLWYLTPSESGAELRCLDLRTGKNVRLGDIAGLSFFEGFSVSPDGRYVLFMRNDHAGSDLMFVERIR